MPANYTNAPYYNAKLYGLADIKNSISQLIEQAAYLPEQDKQQLINCCFFAAVAHEGQKRRSGEPYICHPIKVAEILAKDVRFDLPVLQAAVLHDVIEDTPTEKTEVKNTFGQEVADLVDGVSKLEKDKNVSPAELQARTFEKLVHAMQADPRVVMIKFADRMHNMQTLGALRAEKRRRIAKETLDVYVPIAAHLGMFVFKTELEDLAFRHIYPWRYRIVEKLLQENQERQATINLVENSLQEAFISAGITATIRRRTRGLFKVYEKLKKNRFNKRPLESASIPFVILTDCIENCYRILGIIHQEYRPVSHKLVDHIASPKVNGYQSIHTSVLMENRRVISFQIRTKGMHAVAESGIVAIWRYHNQKNTNEEHLPQDKSMRRWLKNIKILSSLAADSVEFYEAVKSDLSGLDIQVLTPKGEPIALPKGSTVIDFAYHIHSDIGDHLKSATVNGVDVALDYQLGDGQTVELFAEVDANPISWWLRRVKTARAKTAIRHYLRELSDEKLAQEGRNSLKGYLTRRDINYQQLDKMLQQIAEKQYQTSLHGLLHKIALHDVEYGHILQQLQKIAHQDGIVSSITLEVDNHPRVLAKVADVMGKNEANILKIHFPDDTRAQQVSMTFEIHLALSAQLDRIIRLLKKLDFVNHINYEENIR